MLGTVLLPSFHPQNHHLRQGSSRQLHQPQNWAIDGLLPAKGRRDNKGRSREQRLKPISAWLFSHVLPIPHLTSQQLKLLEWKGPLYWKQFTQAGEVSPCRFPTHRGCKEWWQGCPVPTLTHPLTSLKRQLMDRNSHHSQFRWKWRSCKPSEEEVSGEVKVRVGGLWPSSFPEQHWW